MDSATRAFLRAHPSHCDVRDDWPLDPVVPLLARLCLASSLPPPACISSILGIVVRADGAVVFIDPASASGSIAHVLVGGRSRPGEAPEATLRREAAEETGWHVEPIRIVGFRHFRQLGPRHPRMGDRPYPDFLQPVYAAIATEYEATARLGAGLRAELVSADWALEATAPPQRPLLAAALEAAALSTPRAPPLGAA